MAENDEQTQTLSEAEKKELAELREFRRKSELQGLSESEASRREVEALRAEKAKYEEALADQALKLRDIQLSQAVRGAGAVSDRAAALLIREINGEAELEAEIERLKEEFPTLFHDGRQSSLASGPGVPQPKSGGGQKLQVSDVHRKIADSHPLLTAEAIARRDAERRRNPMRPEERGQYEARKRQEARLNGGRR